MGKLRACVETSMSSLRLRSCCSSFPRVQEFCHKSINDGWNLRRTLKQNYEAMGLSTSPMDTLPVKKGDVARKAAQKDREVPLEDTHVIEELTAVQNTPAPAPYQVRSMSINEQKRIQMLLEKHGEDFTAMARDIKINVNQVSTVCCLEPAQATPALV